LFASDVVHRFETFDSVRRHL